MCGAQSRCDQKGQGKAEVTGAGDSPSVHHGTMCLFRGPRQTLRAWGKGSLSNEILALQRVEINWQCRDQSGKALTHLRVCINCADNTVQRRARREGPRERTPQPRELAGVTDGGEAVWKGGEEAGPVTSQT